MSTHRRIKSLPATHPEATAAAIAAAVASAAATNSSTSGSTASASASAAPSTTISITPASPPVRQPNDVVRSTTSVRERVASMHIPLPTPSQIPQLSTSVDANMSLSGGSRSPSHSPRSTTNAGLSSSAAAADGAKPTKPSRAGTLSPRMRFSFKPASSQTPSDAGVPATSASSAAAGSSSLSSSVSPRASINGDALIELKELQSALRRLRRVPSSSKQALRLSGQNPAPPTPSNPPPLARTGSGALANKPSKPKRLLVIEELVQTEQVFVTTLGELLEGFKKPLQEANVLSEQQMNVCFNGFAEIQALHARFLESLEKRMLEIKEQDVVIGDLLLSMTPFLKIYTVCVNNQDVGQDLIANLYENNPKFHAALETCGVPPRQGIIGINDLRARPYQRVIRYKLLCERLLGATPETHSDHAAITKALSQISIMADHVNESKRESEISHSLIILDQSLVGNRESLESEASSNSNPHQWKKHVSVRPLLQSCSRAACTSMILCSYRQCKTCGLICHLDCAHALTEECGKAALQRPDSLVAPGRVFVAQFLCKYRTIQSDSNRRSGVVQACMHVLFNDGIAVITAYETNQPYLVCMIRWYSRTTSRSLTIVKSSEISVTLANPRDSTMYGFIFGSEEERDEWVAKVEETKREYMHNSVTGSNAEQVVTSQVQHNSNNTAFFINSIVPVCSEGKIFHAFVIDITTVKTSIIKRYSEFYDLHTKLCKEIGKQNLPKLPGKRRFGDNNDKRFVEYRAKRLEAYLNGLAERKLLENPLVSEFLNTSMLPTDKTAGSVEGTSTGDEYVSDDEDNVITRVAYQSTMHADDDEEDSEGSGIGPSTDSNTSDGEGHPLYCVLWDFAAATDGEMSATAGDVVAVLERDNADWWYVVHGGRGGTAGYIPSSYLVPYHPESELEHSDDTGEK